MSFDRETGKPKHFQAGSLYFKGAPSEDTRLDLWFPDNRRTEECVSAYASLYPLITYYLNRLNDWGLTAFFLCNASFLKSEKAACIFSRRSAGKPAVFFTRFILLRQFWHSFL